MTLTAEQMRSLPDVFRSVDDPRRRQGQRHGLPTILSLAAAATLSGMRGYKAISEWVEDLSPSVLKRFHVRRPRRRPAPPAQPVDNTQRADQRRSGPVSTPRCGHGAKPPAATTAHWPSDGKTHPWRHR